MSKATTGKKPTAKASSKKPEASASLPSKRATDKEVAAKIAAETAKAKSKPTFQAEIAVGNYYEVDSSFVGRLSASEGKEQTVDVWYNGAPHGSQKVIDFAKHDVRAITQEECVELSHVESTE